MIDENINNEQQSIIEEKPINTSEIDTNNKNTKKSKISKLLKIILVILSVILVLALTLFGLYKSMIDISDKYTSKFDYDLSSEPVSVDYKLTDFLGYNSKTNKDAIRITIPKDRFYNRILGINELTSNYYDEYGIKINRIGTISNATNSNLIDFCADISYKDKINAYISGSIRYEFNDSNGINLYLEKFVIGDGVPMFLYSSFLPFKDGDFITEISADSYEYTKYKALNLKDVDSLIIDSNSLKFNYDYSNNLDNISKYLFGDQADKFTDIMKNVLPIVMEMTFGDNKDEFVDFSEMNIPYIIKQIFE